MARRKKQHVRPRDRYQSTSIPGLFLHPMVLLLNLVVHTIEDDARTDGLIPSETVDKVTALIRHAYDFADLDRSQGKGMLLSLIGQFFHPDDYLEHRVAETHSQAILHALQGDLQPQVFETPDLRTSKMPGLAEGTKTPALYYKQRFLSFCFAGPRAKLDRLRGDVPGEFLNHVLGVLWHDLGISDEAFASPHPAFVPLSRLRRVSQQNAVRWARQATQLMEQGKVDELAVFGPPGPSYVVRPRKQPRARKKR